MNRHLARALAKVRNLFAAKPADEDFEREIDAHLAFLEQEYLDRGHTLVDARQRARLAFGGVEHTRQAYRDERSILWMSQASQDVRHALRAMKHAPGFTASAVLTLALGIGANTAVFSVVNAVLLRPLDYPDPGRIVQSFLMSGGGPIAGTSIPDLRFLLDRANSVQDITAYDFDQSEMGLTSGVPEEVHGIHVTSNYFRLFGAPVLLGRTFDRTDDQPHGPKVIVLSYGLWKRRFAGDRAIVGKEISLDKESYTVLGVIGKSFHSEPEAQLWIPFQFDLNSTDQLHSFQVAARLKPEITLAQANAQLDAASQSARRTSELPDPDLRFQLRRLQDAMARDIRSSLLTLQGAVGFVLLIACANLANLLLVRMIVRRREFAIRAAIGAGSGRIIRQLMVESLLLSFLGCVSGSFVGILGVNLLLKIIPDNLPGIREISATIGLDWRVMAFAVGVSIVTGIVFSILPAFAALRPKLTDMLNETGTRQGLGLRTKWLHSLTIISEVALSLILLIGAALLVRTFLLLNRVDPGFDSHHVLMMTMPMHGSRSESAESLSAMVRDARQQLAVIPGVEASATSFSPPFTSGRIGLPFSSLSPTSEVSGDGNWLAASPGYFHVLKIPIRRGRDFAAGDKSGGPSVVMINETMAKRFWPGQDALGQRIVIGKGLGPKFEDKPRTIVGIFGDTQDNDLARAAEPTMIIPDAQEPDGIIELMSQFGPIWWMVRTRIEPHQVIPAVSEQLRKVSGGRPVGNIRTLDEMLAQSIATQRFNMLLLAIFALTALLLSSVGVYGVIAYSVAERGHEIGVRMALGADRPSVRNMVLREGLAKGTLGVLCGAGAAFFLARLLTGLLFGVSAHDARVFVAMPLVLEIVTAVAAYIPARRAANLDPVRALRGE
jgi:putative ABC transport system permease protein